MKKWFGLFALLFIFTRPALAQQTPAWDVEGAYLFRSFYPTNAPRFGTNGWNASLDHNLRKWIGVTGDFTGTYRNQGVNGDSQIYTFMVGPRIYFLGHRHRLIPYGQVSIWRRIRSPYVSSERRIPQDHVHERRVRVGRRRGGAVETEAQVGPASV